MIDFEYHSPVSLEETFDLLDRYGDDARVMAGGTALVLQMKHRFSQPGHVISLRRVPGLVYITPEQDGGQAAVRVGALCTQRRMETDPVIAETLPLVAETFSRVATPRIRNMGTIGGGLVHGDPNQDPPPALIALGASVTLTSAGGERILAGGRPLHRLLRHRRSAGRGPDQRVHSARAPRLRLMLHEIPAPDRRRLCHRLSSGAG